MGLFGDSSVLGTSGDGATGGNSSGASGNAWLQLGAAFLNNGGGRMLGGGGDTSEATSGGASLNTSGWVVGEGDASGGSSGMSIPWYAWAGLAAALLIIKMKQRKGAK